MRLNRSKKANLINSPHHYFTDENFHYPPLSFNTITSLLSMQPTRHIMLAIITLLLLLIRRLHSPRTRRPRGRSPISDTARLSRRSGEQRADFRIAHGRQVPGRRILCARLRRAESAPHGVGGSGGEAGDALEEAVGFLLGLAGFLEAWREGESVEWHSIKGGCGVR